MLNISQKHGLRLASATIIAVCILSFCAPQAQTQPAPAKTPAEDGMRFARFGEKTKDTLAPKAGGATERIEVMSTDDHIDYVTKAYTLKNANADEVYLFIANAIAKEGGFADRFAPGSCPVVSGTVCINDFKGESILVVTVPEWMISYLDDTIKQLDKPGFKVGLYGNASLYLRPKHRKPSELVEHLTPLASGKQIFHADDSRNVLYLEDIPSFFDFALLGLESFDVPADQMDVSVRIYEIDEGDGRDVGLDWYSWKKSISGGGFGISASNANKPNRFAMDLKSVTAELAFNPTLATEFLNYQTDRGRAKVITDTQMTLVNGRPGTINAVTQVPYVIRGYMNGTVSDQPLRDSPHALDAGGAIKEFVDGVTIGINPTIGADTIQLDVTAQVASHVGYTPNQNVPIISQSNVASMIVVKSGTPAVLGGLKRKRVVEERQGIPGLKEIAWIKYLFSHEVKRERESQIIVTLLPVKAAEKEAAAKIFIKHEAMPSPTEACPK